MGDSYSPNWGSLQEDRALYGRLIVHLRRMRWFYYPDFRLLIKVRPSKNWAWLFVYNRKTSLMTCFPVIHVPGRKLQGWLMYFYRQSKRHHSLEYLHLMLSPIRYKTYPWYHQEQEIALLYDCMSIIPERLLVLWMREKKGSWGLVVKSYRLRCDAICD